jgi:probable rRNA maturation factor
MGVDITDKVGSKKVSVRKIQGAARSILKYLDQDQSELSLMLVDNRKIKELNSRYRSKNEPTDVLSFSPGEGLPGGVRLLGDVVISLEQAEKQAARRKKTLEEEVESLLIHGILHLLGYDHERSRSEARVMRGMERKIREGIKD